MAKSVQQFASPGDPGRVFAHLLDHLANYAQYFSVQQRSESTLALELRGLGGTRMRFGKPGFVIRVTPSGSGSRIELLRSLAPLGRYFFGFFTGASGLAFLGGLAALGANPSDWRKLAPFVGISLGLTVAGLVFRRVYYSLESGRDRELTGIVEKALADYGRPTAVRRAMRENQPGPGGPAV